jgi:uncharacterized protein YcbX
MTEFFIEVGTVHMLNRFPVKSMQGESLDEVFIYWHGFDGDRRFAFVRGDVQSSFPWLSGRQIPQMLLYKPRFVDPNDVINSAVEVETPNGRFLPIHSPELQAELAEAYGADVSLINIGRGCFDSQVLSVMSVETAVSLSKSIGMPVDTTRFRQNIIIKTHSGEPFAEENWLDGVLVFGDRSDSPRIRLNRRIPRCVMINVDPETGERDASVLKTVAQIRENCVGVHASPEKPGNVRVGDVVRLLR